MPDYLRKFGLLLGLLCGLPLLHALISAPRAWAADDNPGRLLGLAQTGARRARRGSFCAPDNSIMNRESYVASARSRASWQVSAQRKAGSGIVHE
jgi:hypothetical protein